MSSCTKEFFASDRCQLCCGHLPWRHWIKLTTHFISIKQQPFSIISHPAGTEFAQVIYVLETLPIRRDIQNRDYVLFSHRNSCICTRKQQLLPLCRRMLTTQFWSLAAKLSLQQSTHVRLEGDFLCPGLPLANHVYWSSNRCGSVNLQGSTLVFTTV